MFILLGTIITFTFWHCLSMSADTVSDAFFPPDDAPGWAVKKGWQGEPLIGGDAEDLAMGDAEEDGDNSDGD